MGGLSNFVGTIGGAGVGFLVGGPAGAAIGAGLGSGLDQSRATGEAADIAAAGAAAGLGETGRQFDITQRNLAPFLQAATGTEIRVPGTNRVLSQGELQTIQQGIESGQTNIEDIARNFGTTPADLTTAFQGGALGQFQRGIEQAPEAPQLQQFGGQAVQAPTLQAFGGQAPTFEQFEFDPQKALESPALQFQREQGEVQLDRLAGKNRLLGSGQRLIEAQKFGQGLASQSLGEEFQRQLQQNQARNQISQQQFGQDVGLSQMEQQRQAQQFGLGSQQLGQEQSLAGQEQNRLLTQFGLGQDAFNQRLNRLAGLVDVGRGTAGTLAQAGQAQGANVSNLLQAQAKAQAAGRIGQTQGVLGGLQQGLGIAAASGAFDPAQFQGAQIPQGGISPQQFISNPAF